MPALHYSPLIVIVNNMKEDSSILSSHIPHFSCALLYIAR